MVVWKHTSTFKGWHTYILVTHDKTFGSWDKNERTYKGTICVQHDQQKLINPLNFKALTRLCPICVTGEMTCVLTAVMNSLFLFFFLLDSKINVEETFLRFHKGRTPFCMLSFLYLETMYMRVFRYLHFKDIWGFKVFLLCWEIPYVLHLHNCWHDLTTLEGNDI